MEIEVGSVYKINHTNHPKSTSIPPSFNSVKAVLVKKKSDEEVTVVYPSNKSLSNFFGAEKFTGSMQPSMDEKFVMGFTLGKKILTQKIPFEEFASQRGSKNFWVLDDHGDYDNGDYDEKSGEGVGVKWETRRRTRYYTRRKSGNNNQKISGNNKVISGNNKVVIKTNPDDDEDDQVGGGVEIKCDNDGGVKKKEVKDEGIAEQTRVLRKRKCQFKGVKYRDDKNKNKKKKKLSNNNNKAGSQKKFIDSQHRWTVERYKLAEMNMLKIMKEKGAGPSNPVLRPNLRAEARKLIGDTGLLDHLLKHMAGNLAPGGKERFCRRHNPEGAMEYWVEGAEMADIRKQAGVDDPSWVPASGWKPGDCTTHDPGCALQLKELKDEVFNMKREIGKLSCSREQENSQMLIAVPETPENAVESLKPLKEIYEELMKRKANVEKALLDISKSFSGMEEEIERLKESAAPATEAMSQNAETQLGKMPETVAEPGKGRRISAVSQEEVEMLSQPQNSTPSEDKAVAATKAAEVEEKGQSLKSGFRICKPKGSFLWPSQVPSSSQSQELLYLEDFLGYPTPPSVSSTSRTPALIFPTTPYHNHQFQRPPPVLKPVASRAPVTLTFSTATVRGSTTINSVASPATTASSSAHNFVPDLNQVAVS